MPDQPAHLANARQPGGPVCHFHRNRHHYHYTAKRQGIF